MKDVVTIGCWAGFWGDTPEAAARVLGGGEIDYLVGDHLAEITMALLARARMKDPAGGYVPDVVRALTPLLSEIHSRGIRVVTNGGGLNPAACAQALRSAAADADVPLSVAYVDGDDVSALVPALRAAGARDMFTGEELPQHIVTANAYLGARPIATALAMGSDIVVTGRCVDSAIVLGPLMHEFGWSDDDYDRLAAGTLIGHIVECGPQCLGGLFTDWWTVPGWEDMGYPIAECSPDGSAIITKPAGSGGLVTPATVGEQILYEIGDPGAYAMPEVVCDWRDVCLEQVGPDRVLASGARGRGPTSRYKATVTALDGFRLIATAVFNGADAGGRARRAGEAMLARAQRLALAEGHSPYISTSVEVLGAGDGVGRPAANDRASEALVKIAARHDDRDALDVIAREMISLGLVAQGMAGIATGRPKPQPVLRLYHVLLDKNDVPVTVVLDDERAPVTPARGTGDMPEPTPQLAEPAAGIVATDNGDRAVVPLRRIAYARSGDKGNHVNIGLIARRPEHLAILREQVTAARVAEVFSAWLEGSVRRWELPGLGAINILLEHVLGGSGGTSSLRIDPQGKSYGAILLELPVEIPASWERDGLIAPRRDERALA